MTLQIISLLADLVVRDSQRLELGYKPADLRTEQLNSLIRDILDTQLELGAELLVRARERELASEVD